MSKLPFATLYWLQNSWHSTMLEHGPYTTTCVCCHAVMVLQTIKLCEAAQV